MLKKLLQRNKKVFDWYFVAFFEDGSVIKQDDVSETNHSTMIDVNAKKDESRLVAFELRHVDGDKKVTVDLKTGAFIVNGIPLEAQSDFNFDHPKHFSPKDHELELCYWRERSETITLSVKGVEDTSSSIGRYFIGWKSGKVQAILAVG